MNEARRTLKRTRTSTTESRRPCNHRGFTREFARQVDGEIRMICTACRREVVPASRRDRAA